MIEKVQFQPLTPKPEDRKKKTTPLPIPVPVAPEKQSDGRRPGPIC